MQEFFLANIELEATVVGIVCIVFLILFVVAGVRSILRNKE
jgi:hypothetical protein